MAVDAGSIKITMRLEDKDFTVSVQSVNRLLNQLKGRLEDTGRSVTRVDQHFSSFFTRFRHGVQMVASLRFAMMDFNDVLLSLPAAVAKTSGEFERMTRLMAGFSREATKAARDAEGLANVKFAFDLAKINPFDVKSITDAMVKFKAVGLDPVDGSLQAILNGMARFGSTSEQLHRVSVALQQMAGKGVISMEELRQQLAEHLPSALNDMASAAGITVAELVARVSKGTVEATSAIALMAVAMRLNSAGAGIAMMDNWVGGLARLKTQWDLFQVDVGNAGFLNEIKIALQEVITLMSGGQGKVLAFELGSAFTSVVRALLDMAAALRENWEWVKNLGIAMTALWAGSKAHSVIMAIVQGLVTWRQAQTTLLSTVVGNHAVIDAAYNKSAIAYSVMATRIKVEQATVSALERQFTARQLANGRFMSAQQRVDHLQRIAEIRERIGLHTAEAVALTRSATASRTAGMAMGLLGGPIGLITTALMLGVTAWQLWGDSAEKGASAARAAAESGVGTAAALIEQNKKLEKATTELQRLIAIRDRKNSRGDSILSEKGRELLKSDISKQEALVLDMRRTIGLTERNIDQNSTEERLTSIKQRFLKTEGAMTEGFEREIDLVKKALEKRGLTEKQVKEEMAKVSVGMYKAESAKRKEFFLQEEADARELLRVSSGTERAVQLQRIDLARKGAREAEKMIKTLDTGLQTSTKTKKPKIGAGSADSTNPVQDPISSPIEKLLARKRSEIARLTVAFGNIREGVEGAEGLKAEIDARIEEMFETDQFRYRVDGEDRDADRAQLEALKEYEFKTTTMQEALKVRSRMILSGGKADVEYNDAIARLRDPLRPKEGSESLSFSKELAQWESDLPKLERIKETLKELGISWSDFVDQGRGRAATIDLAAFMDPLREKTRELRNSMIDDERERQRMEYQEEGNHLRAKFELYVAYLKSRVDGAELAANAQIEFNENMHQRELKHFRDIETPMTKLAREWQNSTKLMQDASVGWANQTVDAIITMAKTGKFEFSKLAESILTDIARIQLQKRIAEPLSNLLDEGIKMLGNMFSPGGGAAGGNPNMPGIDWSVGQLFSANGNVIGPWGKMDLKKFGMGGIARRPQVSIFGEGSKPEAYVPLPDGRSIPVTMDGAMPSVTVNVINQSGTPLGAKQSQPRFDGKQMILDVVVSAMNTAGPFRDTMKQSMGV